MITIGYFFFYWKERFKKIKVKIKLGFMYLKYMYKNRRELW